MENGPGMKMYFLLKMGIFHCYVSLPEGTSVYKGNFGEIPRKLPATLTACLILPKMGPM